MEEDQVVVVAGEETGLGEGGETEPGAGEPREEGHSDRDQGPPSVEEVAHHWEGMASHPWLLEGHRHPPVTDRQTDRYMGNVASTSTEQGKEPKVTLKNNMLL